MTLGEFREQTADLSGDVNIMIAHQPSYPLECSTSDDVAIFTDCHGNQYLYIAEEKGDCAYSDYLEEQVQDILGW